MDAISCHWRMLQERKQLLFRSLETFQNNFINGYLSWQRIHYRTILEEMSEDIRMATDRYSESGGSTQRHRMVLMANGNRKARRDEPAQRKQKGRKRKTDARPAHRCEQLSSGRSK